MPSRLYCRLPAPILSVLIFIAGLLAARMAPAQATFTVTTLTDTAPGTASKCSNQLLRSSLDSACSLRDALAAAAGVNPSSGTAAVTVNFAPSLATASNPGTLTLGATALTLPAYTTVQGATAGSGYSLKNLVSIAGNGHEVFTTDATVMQSALQNLTLTNGSPALRNYGNITVSQCTFANNTYTSGGAIYNYGTMAVLASTFTGNSATSYGAAIYSTSNETVPAGVLPSTRNLTVSLSTFQGNSSAIDGGAIYIGQKSVGSIDSSTFTGNRAARDGAALYLNNGSFLSRVTNSILTGDTGGSECAGFGCDNAALGFVFDGSIPPNASESGTITVTITLSTGQVFTSKQPYGMASTAESLAAGFGGDIFNKGYPMLTAQSFGKTLLMVPPTATLTSVVFDNPSRYFTITPISDAVLSGTGNTVSVGTAAANLSVLSSFGGPTQTVLPLPGSAALCPITPGSAAGTDQRGLPRTAAFATGLCQDSGAVQTNYALAFVQQPAATTIGTILTPSPSVQISESGQKLSQADAPVAMKDLSGSLVGSTTGKTLATGVATFANLSVSRAQTQNTLTASLAVGPNSVFTTSSPFDVTPRPAASLIGNAAFPVTALSGRSSSVFTFTNRGEVRVNITSLSVTAGPEWTQTNTCGLTLAAGATCAVTVTFQPVVEGIRSGALMLASDASGYSQTVALTGTAASPTATLTGTASFSDTIVSMSSAQTFALRNTGLVALNIRSVAATGDFTQTNQCGSSLAAGGSCSVGVVFTPSAVGARTGTLVVVSDSSVAIPAVVLSGTGLAVPAFSLVDSTSGSSSTALTIAAGSAGSGTLKLTSVNGFTGTVVLICAAQGNAPKGASCSITSPITLVAGGIASATVTVSTTSRTLSAGFAALPYRSVSGYLFLLIVFSTTVLALRSASRATQAGSLLLVLLSLVVGMSGCGGGSAATSSSTTTPSSGSTPNPNGTVAGTYNYAITATGGGLTATQVVVVTVQ